MSISTSAPLQLVVGVGCSVSMLVYFGREACRDNMRTIERMEMSLGDEQTLGRGWVVDQAKIQDAWMRRPWYRQLTGAPRVSYKDL